MFDYLIVSLIFFFLGRLTVKIPIDKEKERLDEACAKMNKKIKRHLKLGVVKRPTAEDLKKKDTKVEEGERAMTETLEKIVR